MSEHFRRTFAAALGLALAGAGVAGAADVGEAVLVRNDVKGTLPGAAARSMAAGDRVALGLSVATGAASSIRMTFDPKGALSLGPQTTLTVDQPVVDRATGRSVSKIGMLVGSLRVSLGSQFGGEVEVATPSAVVGIKGTVVAILVAPSGRTTVFVLEGSAATRDKARTSVVEVAEGTFVVVEPEGRPGAARPFDPAALALLEGLLDGMKDAPPPPALPPGRLAEIAADAFGGKPAAGAGGGTALVLGSLSPAAGTGPLADPQLSTLPFSPVAFIPACRRSLSSGQCL